MLQTHYFYLFTKAYIYTSNNSFGKLVYFSFNIIYKPAFSNKELNIVSDLLVEESSLSYIYPFSQIFSLTIITPFLFNASLHFSKNNT